MMISRPVINRPVTKHPVIKRPRTLWHAGCAWKLSVPAHGPEVTTLSVFIDCRN